MKKFLVLLLFISLSVSASYKTASQILYKQNVSSPTPTALISSAQNLTTSWANLGTAQDVSGKSAAGLYLDLDINDSENARVRALLMHTTGGSTFLLPIKTVAASAVKVEPEYYEFNVDADRKMVLTWDLDRIAKFIQFQVQVSATGTTAGQIDAAHLNLGWK